MAYINKTYQLYRSDSLLPKTIHLPKLLLTSLREITYGALEDKPRSKTAGE